MQYKPQQSTKDNSSSSSSSSNKEDNSVASSTNDSILPLFSAVVRVVWSSIIVLERINFLLSPENQSKTNDNSTSSDSSSSSSEETGMNLSSENPFFDDLEDELEEATEELYTVVENWKGCWKQVSAGLTETEKESRVFKEHLALLKRDVTSGSKGEEEM